MILRELLARATAGTVLYPGGSDRFAHFASDSREVSPGALFVAVQGIHTDGHEHADEAVARGATGLLVESARVAQDPARWADFGARGVAVISVLDVRMALRQYAAAVLRTWHPRVIAIAGSAGKTTTKEAIASILSRQASVFRSWRNYNDLLGVPLSLGGLEPHHEYAVIELSCDYPGEIAELASLTIQSNAPTPPIAVILNTLATHLDGLISENGISDALSPLIDALGPDGIAILNARDPRLRDLGKERSGSVHGPRIVWFGEHPESLVVGQVTCNEDVTNPHISLSLEPVAAADPPVWPLRGLYGVQWRDAVLAAVTTTAVLDVAPAAAAASLEDFTALPGRMRPLPGVNNLQILDDSHSALPDATLAALRELARQGRLMGVPTIAVLGDMDHLGGAAEDWHTTIGIAAASTVTALITRGSLAEVIARSARSAGMPTERVVMTHTAEDAARAVRDLAAAMPVPPIVLIKGGPPMRMEQVVAALLRDPTQASAVLDRQRAIWRREIVGELLRPTWLEIDLEAIGANCRALKDIIGPHVALMATLKADAYGHGALKVAHTVLRNGATWLGVATVSEALPLRAAGITAPILVFGYIPPWQARQAVELDVRATVYDRETPFALDRAARALGRVVPVHVKIDTGMGRLGLRAEDVVAISTYLRELHTLPGITIEGIYTHFATADELDLSFAETQLQRFQQVLRALEVRPPIVHAANSAATLRLPSAHFDLVRPGIALYGLSPSSAVPLPSAFRAALSFKTQIALVKVVPANEGISYGQTYVTTTAEHIATLPVGYADGFRRGPTNWGTVLIRGRRAPIRGRVCMDQTMVSIEAIPLARTGDEVVLIGRQGEDAITVEEVAQQLGTSPYEVVAALLARVPRVTH